MLGKRSKKMWQLPCLENSFVYAVGCCSWTEYLLRPIGGNRGTLWACTRPRIAVHDRSQHLNHRKKEAVYKGCGFEILKSIPAFWKIKSSFSSKNIKSPIVLLWKNVSNFDSQCFVWGIPLLALHFRQIPNIKQWRSLMYITKHFCGTYFLLTKIYHNLLSSV